MQTFILVMVVLSIIVLAFLGVIQFAKHFSIVRIKGNSMLPTYKEGDIVLIKRTGIRSRGLKPEDVVVMYSYSGQVVVKRVKEIGGADTLDVIIPDEWEPDSIVLWVEGDNSGQDGMGNLYSHDSREYGYVHEEALIGYVYPQRKRKTN